MLMIFSVQSTKKLFKLLFVFIVFGVVSCSSNYQTFTSQQDSAPTSPPSNLDSIPNAIPQVEAKSRYGNPATYVVYGKTYTVQDSSAGYKARGQASWYGTKFHGRRTSSGEPYDMYAMTAAHTTLPLPTYAKVTNLDNGRSIIVKVNDRGPFHDNRIIDLSYTAAHKLDILQSGVGYVEVEAINPEQAPLQTALLSASTPETQTQQTQTRDGLNLFLQIGAFSSQANANELANRLVQLQAFDVSIVSTTLNNQPLYRVHIGPLPSSEEVAQITQQLAQAALGPPIVLVE